MQYNPILDLVIGIVMILVPVFVLIGGGVMLIIARKGEEPSVPTSPPERPFDDEILRSLELIRSHQDRLLVEMRDLSEDNQKSLHVLQEETERIRDLLRKETSAPGRIESRLKDLDFRDN